MAGVSYGNRHAEEGGWLPDARPGAQSWPPMPGVFSLPGRGPCRRIHGDGHRDAHRRARRPCSGWRSPGCPGRCRNRSTARNRTAARARYAIETSADDRRSSMRWIWTDRGDRHQESPRRGGDPERIDHAPIRRGGARRAPGRPRGRDPSMPTSFCVPAGRSFTWTSPFASSSPTMIAKWAWSRAAASSCFPSFRWPSSARAAIAGSAQCRGDPAGAPRSPPGRRRRRPRWAHRPWSA